jgi:hypothetical protein
LGIFLNKSARKRHWQSPENSPENRSWRTGSSSRVQRAWVAGLRDSGLRAFVGQRVFAGNPLEPPEIATGTAAVDPLVGSSTIGSPFVRSGSRVAWVTGLLYRVCGCSGHRKSLALASSSTTHGGSASPGSRARRFFPSPSLALSLDLSFSRSHSLLSTPLSDLPLTRSLSVCSGRTEKKEE